jgi:hypothetical protein
MRRQHRKVPTFLEHRRSVASRRWRTPIPGPLGALRRREQHWAFDLLETPIQPAGGVWVCYILPLCSVRSLSPSFEGVELKKNINVAHGDINVARHGDSDLSWKNSRTSNVAAVHPPAEKESE